MMLINSEQNIASQILSDMSLITVFQIRKEPIIHTVSDSRNIGPSQFKHFEDSIKNIAKTFHPVLF